MKTKKTLLGALAAILLMVMTSFAQVSQSVPFVTSSNASTGIAWTAGTVNNGGHPVTVAAGSSTISLNKTDCTSPVFANCNFVVVNSAGTVSVTTSLSTAQTSGNSLLALIEAGAVTVTQVVYPWQSGTLWMQAAGPQVSFSGSPTPAIAGGSDLGTTALPWANLWLGTAATNNIQINALATAAARKVVLADQGASAALAIADPSVTTKIIAFDASGMTAAKTLTIAASSANSRTYTLPDIGGAATFAFTNPTSAQSILFNGGLTASGAVSNDFSGGSGTFKTSTGAATFGGSSNTFNGTTPQIVFGTAGSVLGGFQFTNLTSGTITVNPPTGALGAVTVQVPDTTGGMPVVINCGSVAAAGACANTNTNGTAHIFYGLFTLAGNSSLATGLSPAYTSITSYACSGTVSTGTAATIKIANTSASTITITNPGGGATDVVSVICVGN